MRPQSRTSYDTAAHARACLSLRSGPCWDLRHGSLATEHGNFIAAMAILGETLPELTVTMATLVAKAFRRSCDVHRHDLDAVLHFQERSLQREVKSA